MIIYSARHGETDWNREDKICGRTDIPLNENGIRQAKELAQYMSDKGIDIIIASPMFRAQQTAGYVAEVCGVEIITDERLIEQDYGIYEGKDRFCEGFLNNKRQFAYRYPGGESMMQVAQRVYAVIEDVKSRYSDKTVLLVSHGGVCRVLNTYFHDMTNDEFFHFCQLNAAAIEYNTDD